MEIYHPQDEELVREMRRVRRAGKRKRILWGLLAGLVLSALFGWLVFTRYYALAVCEGPGMGTAVPGGSLVLVRRGTEGIRQGDLVLYETDHGWQLKRVTAAAGDRVVISPYEGVRVNSAGIAAGTFAGRTEDTGLTAWRLTVPEGELFVQGDQLSLSVDSRFRNVGTVKTEKVVGKAAFILWPLSRFGTPDTTLRTEGGAGE